MGASREELEGLIRSADAAGDADAVRVLFEEMDKLDKPSMSTAPFPDIYGGTGGYNPMLSGVMGLANRTGESLGMTPENTSAPQKNALGPAETALQLGSGAASLPISGIAGIGQGLWNMVVPKSMEGPQAADRVRQVQQSMTYQPRTGAGVGMSTVAAKPMEAYSAGTNFLGEKTTDITGLPSLGAFVKTAGDIAPSLVGARGAFKRTPKLDGEYTPTKYDVPTTEQLKKASQDAYAAAKESGVVVPKEGYNNAANAIGKMVTDEGIDPTLHPKSSAVMKRLEGARGKDLTLQEAETLRKIALDAEDDLNPVTRQPTPDARLAGKIVDELDEKIEALSANDQARALWSRSRKSQMIDRAIARAEVKAGASYTQSGMENALRKEFQALALNERRMRGLTKDQQEAIKKVAAGGKLENSLRALGKFDPLTGGMSSAVSLVTSGSLAPLTGGASFALPIAGIFGKRMATRMTGRNVDAAREALVGRGLPPPASLPAPRAAPANPFASLDFTATPGVFQSRTGPLSRGIELEPQPVLGAQEFPQGLPVRDLTASSPPPMLGGIEYRPAPMRPDLDSGLQMQPPNPSYPGGLDFTPSKIPPQIPPDLALRLVDETPATPAKARSGSLELPVTRAKKDIQADIRRLEARIRGLSREQEMDGSYTNAISQEWQALQKELASSESRAKSR